MRTLFRGNTSMSLKTFRFAVVGCLAMAMSASAATVTMTASPNTNRPQTQGQGNYDVYDFFWTNEPGSTFTNYTVTGVATSGNFNDPARLQDDRQERHGPPVGREQGDHHQRVRHVDVVEVPLEDHHRHRPPEVQRGEHRPGEPLAVVGRRGVQPPRQPATDAARGAGRDRCWAVPVAGGAV